MFSSRDFNSAGFYQAIVDRGLQAALLDIDTAYSVATEGGFFSAEFLQRVEERAGKSLLREVFRRGIVDADGVVHEAMCIEEIDPATQEVVKGYKQLEFFTVDDFEWAIDDTMRRIKSDKSKLDKLMKLLQRKHGKKGVREIQERLGFVWDEVVAG